MPAKKSLAMLLGSVLLLGSGQLMAAGPSATLLGDTCAGCHGIDGASGGPAIPSIAGMSAEYFKDTMKQYQEDDRKSTIMGRIARGYTDAEVALMADYFAGKPIHMAKQKLDADKIEAGSKLYKKNCGKCHDENGGLADDDSGILAGQWLPYLQYSMEDFKSGDREMPKKMAKKVNKLDQFDLEALNHFFASQQ